MTKQDMRELCEGTAEILRDLVAEIARHHAEDIVYRVLEIDHADLRNRVRTIIREVVREETGKHLNVEVTWR